VSHAAVSSAAMIPYQRRLVSCYHCDLSVNVCHRRNQREGIRRQPCHCRAAFRGTESAEVVNSLAIQTDDVTDNMR